MPSLETTTHCDSSLLPASDAAGLTHLPAFDGIAAATGLTRLPAFGDTAAAVGASPPAAFLKFCF